MNFISWFRSKLLDAPLSTENLFISSIFIQTASIPLDFHFLHFHLNCFNYLLIFISWCSPKLLQLPLDFLDSWLHFHPNCFHTSWLSSKLLQLPLDFIYRNENLVHFNRLRIFILTIALNLLQRHSAFMAEYHLKFMKPFGFITYAKRTLPPLPLAYESSSSIYF